MSDDSCATSTASSPGCATAGSTPACRFPTSPGHNPKVSVADEHRWTIVERLVNDTTIRRYTRIGGLFTLLFAQPLSRLVAMRVDQISEIDGRVHVAFHSIPIQMPPRRPPSPRPPQRPRQEPLCLTRHPVAVPRRQPRADTSPPRTSGPSSSRSASTPTNDERPPCSNSPATSPHLSSPNSSGSPTTTPPTGHDSPLATGPATSPTELADSTHSPQTNTTPPPVAVGARRRARRLSRVSWNLRWRSPA